MGLQGICRHGPDCIDLLKNRTLTRIPSGSRSDAQHTSCQTMPSWYPGSIVGVVVVRVAIVSALDVAWPTHNLECDVCHVKYHPAVSCVYHSSPQQGNIVTI